MSTAAADKAPSGVPLKDKRLFREQAYIAGEWIDADRKAVIEVDDPARRETIGVVPKLGAAETRRAIDAAAKAYPAW